jgi:hypothetical protein
MLCENKHCISITEHGSTSSNLNHQGKDITDIRTKLWNASCAWCLNPIREEPRRNAQWPGVEYVVPNNETLERIDNRHRIVLSLIREGNAMEAHNEDNWGSIASVLTQMQGMARDRSNRQGPNMGTVDLSIARQDVEEAMTQQMNMGRWQTQEAWYRIESQLSNVQDMAEERIVRERRAAEISRQIHAHLYALQTLMQENMY